MRILKEELYSLATAFTFFTRLPLGAKGFFPEKALTYLPLVALLLGGGLYLLDRLWLGFFSPELRALLVLGTQYGAANFFHFDGFIDVIDALSASGDRKKRLALLKTPEVGALGLLYGFFFLLGEFLLLKTLLSQGRAEILLFKPLAGRLGLLWGVLWGRAARKEGLGFLFLSSKAKGRAFPALILSGLLLARYPQGLFLILAVGLGLVFYFRRRFGGLTGDHLGALVQISEILFLFSLLG